VNQHLTRKWQSNFQYFSTVKYPILDILAIFFVFLFGIYLLALTFAVQF